MNKNRKYISGQQKRKRAEKNKQLKDRQKEGL